MKTKLYAAFLMITVYAFSGFELIAQPFVGQAAWFNKYSNTVIKTDQERKGLYIKGIHSYENWSFFEYYGGNIFVDKSGNRVSVKNSNTLVYKSRVNKRKLTFKKMQSTIISETYPGYENNYHSSSPRENDFLDNNSGSIPPVYATPEGTWYIPSIQKYLYITETRDGLKARIKDNREWFSYIRNGNPSYEFISSTGSRYILQNDGTMIWMKADGRDRLLLKKISSEFQ